MVRNASSSGHRSALHRTAIELQTKDFSLMYDFNGKETLREMILNVLAVSSKPLTKVKLKDLFADKNVYRSVQDLRKLGAIKEDTAQGTILF